MEKYSSGKCNPMQCFLLDRLQETNGLWTARLQCIDWCLNMWTRFVWLTLLSRILEKLIPCILWDPNVHYHVNILITCFSLRAILTLPSHLCPGHPICLFPSGFLSKFLYAFLIAHMHAACPSHLIRLNLITVIIYILKITVYGVPNFVIFSIPCYFLPPSFRYSPQHFVF